MNGVEQVSDAAGALSPLETLERLLDVPAGNLPAALSHAADVVAAALSADKVDAFIHDPARASLVAVGTSNQPLSALQRKLGLDVLALANGGRAVEVFQTGRTLITGDVANDADELRGIREALGIRSHIGVPLEVGSSRRGMLLVASQRPNFFKETDARYAEAVARWVGIIVHRAELVSEIAKEAAEQGRRAVAEELITVMAHDLRNVIAPISLRLTLLHRRAERDQRQQDVRDLDLAAGGLRRLSTMVSDILDVARIDQGVYLMNVEPVEAVAVLQDIAKVMSTPEHPVMITSAEELVIAADVARFRQCIENLISNALKHSPRGGSVTVRVERKRSERGEHARIEVMDEGPGIPPELLPHLFERFVTSERREGGMGLGLYLARQIARLHDGELTVDAGSVKGADFVLTWPCYQAL